MSKTIIVDIRDSAFPPVSVKPGTYVVWRNLDPYPHTAETETSSEFFFNAGPMLPGETSPPVLFTKPGVTTYRCRYHAGMTGTVSVEPASTPVSGDEGRDHMHMHGAHLHGFVTGGRSGERLFMTHTPVLADPRHHFQVILQGSLTEKKHVDAYNAIRSSTYGDRRVQVFHEHISLEDIGRGKITELPAAQFAYYPDFKHPDDIQDFPGLEANIPVKLDKVIHFHQFDVDADASEALEYLVYGDLDDIFIDHFINRAPSFHSVAKLAAKPSFWDKACLGSAKKIQVPGKTILPLVPKTVQRIAFVDNCFHIFWLPPSGLYTPAPRDPLIPRDPAVSEPFEFNIIVEDNSKSTITIGRFLHFDVRLLNHGVFLPDNA